ncbi:MAG: YaaL family protein [Liquorilactobacillus ghanensis]|jgi:hypothetical protein|uniref:DUF2508 domain-containing protein n=1 Tax=Liquorilactobacillus ghanensis DSM 18630 TaxID=1423750 RepID=A0A0R1VV19_9LACO|nr:YaaL family protein [Liquorilactobacillus ghanensis]KRM06598.1 hypothetical protein FC89_GL000751 [Liquorilactobacillus ghanensis DSM 18630]
MFGHAKHNLRHEYDEYLLAAIEEAADNWEKAKQTRQAMREEDDELSAEVDLAGAKYTFLYLEARRRHVKAHFRPSMIEHD